MYKTLLYSIGTMIACIDAHFQQLFEQGAYASGMTSRSDFIRISLAVLLLFALLYAVEYFHYCCLLADMLILSLSLRLCVPCTQRHVLSRSRQYVLNAVILGIIVANSYRYFFPHQHYHCMTITFMLMITSAYLTLCKRRLRDAGYSCWVLFWSLTIVFLPWTLYALFSPSAKSQHAGV